MYKAGIEIFDNAETGIVEEQVTPQGGRVKGLGTYWPARLDGEAQHELEKGQKCQIVGREGIILLVK